MNNEQLLTNGICPKCFKPLYVSKRTDATLCECEYAAIKPIDKPLEQELRDIRDKWFMEWGLNPNVTPDSMFPLTAEDINTIQTETYNLGLKTGRDEVEQMIVYKLNDNKNIEIGDGYRNGVVDCLIQIKKELLELKEKK